MKFVLFNSFTYLYKFQYTGMELSIFVNGYLTFLNKMLVVISLVQL